MYMNQLLCSMSIVVGTILVSMYHCGEAHADDFSLLPKRTNCDCYYQHSGPRLVHRGPCNRRSRCESGFAGKVDPLGTLICPQKLDGLMKTHCGPFTTIH